MRGRTRGDIDGDIDGAIVCAGVYLLPVSLPTYREDLALETWI